MRGLLLLPVAVLGAIGIGVAASTMALVLRLPGGRRRLTLSPTTIARHAAAGLARAALPLRLCVGVLEGPALVTRRGGTVFAASTSAPGAASVRALLSSIQPSGR